MKFLFGDAAWWTTFLVAAFTGQVAVLVWFLTRCKSIRRLDAWLRELSGLDSRAKEILDSAFQAARHRSFAGSFPAALHRYTEASRDLEVRLRQRRVATYAFVLAPLASGLAIISMQFKPQPAVAEWLVGAAAMLLTTECWSGLQIVFLEVQYGPAKDGLDAENRSIDSSSPTGLPALLGSTFPSAEPASFNRSTAPPLSHSRATAVRISLEGGVQLRVEFDNAWDDYGGCCLLSPQPIQGQLVLEIGGTVFDVAVVECNEFGTRFAVQVRLCDLSEQPRFRGTLSIVGRSLGQQVGSS